MVNKDRMSTLAQLIKVKGNLEVGWGGRGGSRGSSVGSNPPLRPSFIKYPMKMK